MPKKGFFFIYPDILDQLLKGKVDYDTQIAIISWVISSISTDILFKLGISNIQVIKLIYDGFEYPAVGIQFKDNYDDEVATKAEEYIEEKFDNYLEKNQFFKFLVDNAERIELEKQNYHNQ